MSFENAINTILKHEGVFSDDKNDPGGVTKYGISLRYLMTNPDGDINGDGVINADDIKMMTIAQAARFYKADFWDKNKLDLINDQYVQTKIFDMSVNMGIRQANIIVQKSLNTLNPQRPLLVDGILGSKSFAAINNCLPVDLIFTLCKQSVIFYTELVKQKPKLGVFLKGWLARANSTCGLSLK